MAVSFPARYQPRPRQDAVVAYVSLYRKYRPQTFSEIVGQEHVTRTLAQALVEDRLHHAYLFTGPRGTGKTSIARILAKAVNCERGPTAEPCNVCTHCTAITAGSSVDVIEIDAASHGGVDDVRDLRDRVAFAPASARMKVYIVDECHMLSTAGWNAFLKTVEEPPGHVLFVFATTEPHKVLATILSRTQRFDFKRVAAEALGRHVEDLAAREQVSIEPGAVELVVRAGDGSVRDTLSVLDQVVAFTGTTVTAAGVADVLGATPGALLAEAADGIAAGDVAGLCALVGRVADAGQDPRQFARDLVEHLRALFLVQVAPGAGLVEATPEQLRALEEQAGRLGRSELLRAVELLADAQASMRRGNTRLPLELALCKAAMPEHSGDPAALSARLDRLEQTRGATAPAAAPAAEAAPTPEVRVHSGADTRQSAPAEEAVVAPAPVEPPTPEVRVHSGADTRQSAPAEEVVVAPAPVEPPTPEASGVTASVEIAAVRARWDEVMESVKARKMRFHAMLQMGEPESVEGDTLVLRFRAGYGLHAEQCGSGPGAEVIAEAIEGVLGTRMRLRCMLEAGDGTPPPVDPDSGPSLAEQEASVYETEAAEAAGELPDDGAATAQALETLTRELGATIVDGAD